jgi:hypothetical protein
MSTKQTMKSKVLDFVESQGKARYTDIIRFIVDTKFGEGTFDRDAGTDLTWGPNGKHVKCNPWRGYYSGAFVKPYRITRGENAGKMVYPGYFFKDSGYGYLILGQDGLYRTVR